MKIARHRLRPPKKDGGRVIRRGGRRCVPVRSAPAREAAGRTTARPRTVRPTSAGPTAARTARALARRPRSRRPRPGGPLSAGAGDVVAHPPPRRPWSATVAADRWASVAGPEPAGGLSVGGRRVPVDDQVDRGVRMSAALIDADPVSSQSDDGPTGRDDESPARSAAGSPEVRRVDRAGRPTSTRLGGIRRHRTRLS